MWRIAIDEEQNGLTEHWQVTGLPSYREVSIPHTYNIEPQTEEYRGMAWYEYHFIPEANWENKRIRLQFNGVYRDADVWINGSFLGKHYNSGFTTFVLDAKQTIVAGKENILTVCVQNHFSSDALPMDRRFDWADDGGIFREVNFIITEFDAIDHVKLLATPVINTIGARQSTASAFFSAHVYLCEPIGEYSDLNYTYKIFKGCDQDKELIYESDPFPINCTDFELNPITLNEVTLWHFDHPQLYTVIITLHSGRMLSDQLSIAFGFREFKTLNSQFVLNGEFVKLVGTEFMPGSNPSFGNAEPKEYLYKIMTQLKESNCVFTRFHWQQDDAIYDWCDRNGMLVQEEIPNWGLLEPPGSLQLECSKKQTDEMLKSHYNHPSIISWGMANELKGQDPQTVAFMVELKKYIKSMDPTRFVTYITNTMWDGAADATLTGDFLMINEYIGTWHKGLDTVTELRKVIAANPDRVLVMSEFGLCEPRFSGGDSKRSKVFKQKMDIYRKFPEIGGTINFCLNDYRTQMGEEGKGKLKRRVHGSTDIFGEYKPSYYIVQEECSPLKATWVEVSSATCTLALQARNDLPSYLVENYYLRILDEAEVEQNKIAIPTLKPGDSCQISMDLNSTTTLQICRPNGFVVKTLSVGSL
jgi:beta-glucuronidase